MIKSTFEGAMDLLTVLGDPVKYQAFIADIQKERIGLETVRNEVVTIGTAQDYLKTAERQVGEAEIFLAKAKEEAARVQANAQDAATKLLAELNSKIDEKHKEIDDAKLISKELKERLVSTKKLEEKLSKEMQMYQGLNAELQTAITEYNEKKTKLLNALS